MSVEKRVWRLGLSLALCASDYVSVRLKVLDRLSLCLCIYTCMRESVQRSKWSLCLLVCKRVRMWFLARASAEIGLPVGAVCRESGEAEQYHFSN